MRVENNRHNENPPQRIRAPLINEGNAVKIGLIFHFVMLMAALYFFPNLLAPIPQEPTLATYDHFTPYSYRHPKYDLRCYLPGKEKPLFCNPKFWHHL